MLKAKEFRSKTKEDLEKHLQEEQIKLRDLNFKKAGSQVKNFNEFRIIRKNIAVLSTILSELKNK
jgi:ribosomal protein L29